MHGDSPMVCGLVKAGLIEPRVPRTKRRSRRRCASRAQRRSCRRPSPRTRIRAVLDEAEAAKQAGEERVILFNLCGHGHFDMSAYDAYLAGKLEDPEFSEADMEAALERLPRRRHPALPLSSSAMTDRSADALEAMNEAVLAIAAERSVERVLQRIVEVARELAGARYAALGIPDGEGGFAQFITTGMTEQEVAAMGPLPRTGCSARCSRRRSRSARRTSRATRASGAGGRTRRACAPSSACRSCRAPASSPPSTSRTGRARMSSATRTSI